MLLEVPAFCDRVDHDLDGLVYDLQDETRRATPSEATAWRNSLPAFARVLRHDALKSLHVQIGGPGDVAVEYRLPASAAWADAILLGRDEAGPAAVVVELKDWDTRNDQPGPREGIVVHADREVSHPSDQVRGYVEYCRRFHSAVQEMNARVSGCVLFTYASDASPYRAEPHSALVAEYPVFTRSREDLADHLPAHLARKLPRPDPDFAKFFEHGQYRQDRGFVKQIGQAILDPVSSPFVLLDEQRVGFELCLKHVERILSPAKASAKRDRDHKSVVVVQGPPGSGKSVLAAHIWAVLAGDDRVDGNVVLTTTSSSQKSNWQQLMRHAGKDRAARWVTLGANQYNPGLSATWANAQREHGVEITVASWRENLRRYIASGGRNRCEDNSIAVSVVDEAHALIDPTVPGKEGVPPSGWSMHAGPQAWHVIRASRVSIFLMDSEQSYRDNETTTTAQIEAFAREFGIKQVERVNLENAQFRCAGSKEYLDWLSSLFGFIDRNVPVSSWRAGRGGPFALEIARDLWALDEALTPRVSEGKSVRLLAPYARPWRTKKAEKPHALPPQEKDFWFPEARPGRPWARIWNFAPNADYTYFVQAPDGTPMSADPLSEVGCPYVVRGFDFDYTGVLWLSDLVWRAGRWRVQLEHVHETACKNTRAAARREGGDGPATRDLLHRLQRGYRILLSRAIRGSHIWFEDAETRTHVESLLDR